LVSRSVELTRAPFSGCYADECEHLAKKNLKLIDFEAHLARVAVANVSAISNVRFGYEDEDSEDEIEDEGAFAYPWDQEDDAN
jgi:hypothetical protein